MFFVFLGTNGVGKDTIASLIARPQDIVINSSKLLMHQLGIIKSFEQTEVPTKKYQALEAYPQHKLDIIYRNSCDKVIRKLCRDRNVFLTTHLVVYVNGHYKIIRHPDWVLNADGVIFLKSRAKEILARRKHDGHTRRILNLNQIIEHQRLIDKCWKKFTKKTAAAIVIWNHKNKIKQTATKVKKFITNIKHLINN